MKIIFCGRMYDDAENEIKKMKHPGPISGHNYQINLLNGLIKNSIDVYVVNSSNINRYPNYPQKIIKEKDFTFEGKVIGESTGFVNLFAIHMLSRYLSMKKALLNYLKNIEKNNKNEKIFLLCFNYNLPVVLAMYKAQKKYKNIYLCSSMGDLPGKYGVISLIKCGFIRRTMVRFMEDFSERIIKKFDCFAFATEAMASALGVDDKPFTIVECMYSKPRNISENSVIKKDTNEKIIFYAGTLRSSFGIQHLLDSFELIDSPEYRLYIAGDGEAIPQIKEYADKDKRISYLGVLTPTEVNRIQNEATVMINPRIAGNYEYVKYSFPCKSVEGLATGKPYIAHKLPCDLPEYSKYIQYADDESDEALARKIIEVCNLSEAERNNIGEASKKFIENEKNPAVMTKKIIEMWKAMPDIK